MDVKQLFESFWQWRLQNCPEFATFCGIHDYDDQLESFSIEAFEKTKADVEQFLSKVLELLSKPDLESEAKDNLELLKYELQVYLDGSKARAYFFPITYWDGPHNEFERLIKAMPKETVKDYENILSRYNNLLIQVTEMINAMKQGISQNMTLHKMSVATVPEDVGVFDQLSVLEQNPEEYVFYKPFVSLPDSFTDDEKVDLQNKALMSIKEAVIPAFKSLGNFFTEEYFNHTRPEIASSSMPDGEAFYQSCLDFHLSCHMSPKEIHALGLKEVERISGEMRKIIQSLNLNMTTQEFSNKIRNDKKLFFKDPEEALSTFKHFVFDQVYSLLPQIVLSIPKAKLEISSCLPSMSGGPNAFYLAGSMDGKVPGVFYVNTTDCSNSLPKYEMVALALHEAVPGHHLQASYVIENTKLPMFRRNVEDRKYSLAPTCFSQYTGYIEGWGLYCEYLGHELGLYKDPYDHFGHLSAEMMRATRLVVDTGIHAFGWSFDKAVEYMLEHTATAKNNIEREVKRYVTWPGQACAYKVGELKIKSLRNEAETALGSRFYKREFHDMVLNNCGPLNILEKKTKEFIRERA